MKICVLGPDSAAPEVVFGDERLVNLRRLMDLGVYGCLQSVIPAIPVRAWMCMSTSQDPGSLGVYGFLNRSDHSYEKLGFASATSIKTLAAGTSWRGKARSRLSSACAELAWRGCMASVSALPHARYRKYGIR